MNWVVPLRVIKVINITKDDFYKSPRLGSSLKKIYYSQESRTRFNFTTAVCKSWNVTDKYTWDNAADLKQLSMDLTLSEDNRSD